MAHRIRYAMGIPEEVEKLSGPVEADETYIGGRHHGKRGRGALGKTPVVTLVQREGQARSQVVVNVTGENIQEVLETGMEPGAVLMTDSFQVYTEHRNGARKIEDGERTVRAIRQAAGKRLMYANTAGVDAQYVA